MKSVMTILLAVASLFIVSSCGKTSTTPGGGGTSGQLKSLTFITMSGTVSDTLVTTFTYDSQNRVITETSAGNVVTYAYYTDSVVQTESGVPITYILNSQGYKATSSAGSSWTYNSAGYMLTSTSPTSTTTYTYNSSNQLATQTQVITGGTTTTDTYSYSSNPISKAGSSWNTGESAGALWATDVRVTGSVTTTLSFTYTLNSQNLLGEEVQTSSNTSQSPVTTFFTYY